MSRSTHTRHTRHTRTSSRRANALRLAVALVMGVSVFLPVHSAFASGIATSNLAHEGTAVPGFDVCNYPSTSAMQTWWNSSPYRWVNLYLGGLNRSCKSAPSASWIAAVAAMGWSFLPTYVGLQAPYLDPGVYGTTCVDASGGYASMSATPSTAASQGTSEADDAANSLAAAGIGAGAIIYDDIEHYNPDSQGVCNAAILAYINAWDNELHARGYRAGVYMAFDSDNLPALIGASITEPDDVWIAEGGFVSSGSGYSSGCTPYGVSGIADSNWSSRRVYQYLVDGGAALGHNETWGGVTIDLIDSDCADGEILGHKVVTSQTTPSGPALATFNSQLYVSWRGSGNNELNVQPTANGATFGSKVTLTSDTTFNNPSLAGFNGSLFLAYTATNNTIYITSSSNGSSFGTAQPVSEATSYGGPAIAVFGSKLYLAWHGTDGDLDVASSSDGHNFGPPVLLHQTAYSATSPALNSFNSHLYVAWTGTDSATSLNVESSADGVNFGNKVKLSESSSNSPALTHDAGRLIIGWKGQDAHLNVESSTNGTSFGYKETLGDSTVLGPALASFLGSPYLAWVGTDSAGTLNVATTTN